MSEPKNVNKKKLLVQLASNSNNYYLSIIKKIEKKNYYRNNCFEMGSAVKRIGLFQRWPLINQFLSSLKYSIKV